MNNDKITISLKEIKDLIPSIVTLIYIDYNENLDDHHHLLQKCINKGNLDDLYEKVDEWYMDSELNSIETYLIDLQALLVNKFNLSEDYARSILEEYKEEIMDELYSRCGDTPIDDLIRNTSKPIAHYNTKYYMDHGSYNWSKERITEERENIKNLLNIKTSKYNSKIDMMIMQATYGGELLIFFKLNIKDFFSIKEDIKVIEFSNAHIGIIDMDNGSGDVTELTDHTFQLPYNSKNVFLEKAINYNWTYDIAGMVEDWCDSTEYKFL